MDAKPASCSISYGARYGAANAPRNASPAPKPQYNPFDVGISRAIASARESLAMTKPQQDQALRSSMLTFADNMSQQPKVKGFWNNFGAVSRALSPAIQKYDEEENTAIGQNNELANQILHYQQQEEAANAMQEEREWHRQHAENQLGEQRRHHGLLEKFQSDKNSLQASNPADKPRIKHNTDKEILEQVPDKFARNG